MKLSSTYYTLPEAVAVPVGEIIEPDTLPQAPQTMTVQYFGHVEKIIIGDSVTYTLHHPEGYITLDALHRVDSWNYFRRDHLGNNVAVWNASADTTIQRMFYYPSGLPIGISTGQGAQPYKYNGKEFVEMHGLNEYDSHARWYYPAIMRTTTMDPLAEKYYIISPYAWCGNNMVNRFDPDGRKWKTNHDISIAQMLYNRAQSNISKQLSRLSKLQVRKVKCSSGRKQARIDKQIADSQIQIKLLCELERNITLLTNTEKNIYTFKTIKNSNKVIMEKGDDGTIIINNLGNEGSQAHELTHAAQYENGKLVYVGERTKFKPTVAGGMLELEVEAYQTEYSISGEVTSSDNGDAESVADIDAEWVMGVYDIDRYGHKTYPYEEYRTSVDNPVQGVMPCKYEPQKLGL